MSLALLLHWLTNRLWRGTASQNGGPVYWTETPAYPHGGSANNYPLSKRLAIRSCALYNVAGLFHLSGYLRLHSDAEGGKVRNIFNGCVGFCLLPLACLSTIADAELDAGRWCAS